MYKAVVFQSEWDIEESQLNLSQLFIPRDKTVHMKYLNKILPKPLYPNLPVNRLIRRPDCAHPFLYVIFLLNPYPFFLLTSA